MAANFPDLAAALANEDVVAVALALRSAGVVVPLLPDEGSPEDDPPQVRVFRRGDADRYMLLLFSSEETYRRMLPEEAEPPVSVYERVALLDFLEQNAGVLETVWFDLAGPHAMQAEPADVIAALKL